MPSGAAMVSYLADAVQVWGGQVPASGVRTRSTLLDETLIRCAWP
jgi:hypothetical protein